MKSGSKELENRQNLNYARGLMHSLWRERIGFRLRQLKDGLYAWIFIYPKHPLLFKVDLGLFFLYLGDTPYQVSKRHLQGSPTPHLLTYGETSIRSFEAISSIGAVTSSDVVYELGCGRGRGVFFLGLTTQCQGVGIDFVPEFIERANKVSNYFGLNQVRFIYADFLEIDLSLASFLYLHGTCLEDEDILKLTANSKKCKPGTRALTVSFSLTEYDKEGRWRLLSAHSLEMSWGTAQVFLQILT